MAQVVRNSASSQENRTAHLFELSKAVQYHTFVAVEKPRESHSSYILGSL
jgi:hypothetical protein